MLSVPHLKFCEGIITGLCRSAAYSAAFPSANRVSARSRGSRLYRKSHIQGEIARMRGGGPEHAQMAGSALLSHVEMRAFLARVVRGELGPEEDSGTSEGAPSSDTRKGAAGAGGAAKSQHRSGNTVSIRDRLLALKLASTMTPVPDPEVNAELEAFRDIIRRVRSRPWRPPDAPTRNINPHQADGSQVDGPPTSDPQAVVPTTSGAQASGHKLSDPQVNGPQASSHQLSSPQVNRPQMSGAQLGCPQVQGNQLDANATPSAPQPLASATPTTQPMPLTTETAKAWATAPAISKAGASAAVPAAAAARATSPVSATAEVHATSQAAPELPAAVIRSNERYVQDFPSPIPPGYAPPPPRPRPRPSGRYRSVVGKHTCR